MVTAVATQKARADATVALAKATAKKTTMTGNARRAKVGLPSLPPPGD